MELAAPDMYMIAATMPRIPMTARTITSVPRPDDVPGVFAEFMSSSSNCASSGSYFGFLTSMNKPPARASTPTMNDAVARRSWFVAINTMPATRITTPTAIRIMAVVRGDGWLLDPVAELMIPP
jgi:hypothetical protein